MTLSQYCSVRYAIVWVVSLAHYAVAYLIVWVRWISSALLPRNRMLPRICMYARENGDRKAEGDVGVIFKNETGYGPQSIEMERQRILVVDISIILFLIMRIEFYLRHSLHAQLVSTLEKEPGHAFGLIEADEGVDCDVLGGVLGGC